MQAEALRRRGVDVLLVTSDQHPESDAARDYELVLDPRLRRAATWPATLAAWRRVREYRPDVVIAELVADPRWIALAGSAPRVQLVHDDRPHDPGEQWWPAYTRAVFERWGASSAATVTYSDYVAAGSPPGATWPAPACMFCRFPATSHPAPGSSARRPRRPPRLRDDRPAPPYKNVDVVLEAWQRHVAGDGWRGDDLVLIGDGPVAPAPYRSTPGGAPASTATRTSSRHWPPRRVRSPTTGSPRRAACSAVDAAGCHADCFHGRWPARIPAAGLPPGRCRRRRRTRQRIRRTGRSIHRGAARSRRSEPLREQIRRRPGRGWVARRHHRGAGRSLAGSVHSRADRAYHQGGAVTREPVGALQLDDLSISAVQGDVFELPPQIRREEFDPCGGIRPRRRR